MDRTHLVIVVSMLLASGAEASSRPALIPTASGALDGLVKCQAVRDDPGRLACLDREVTALIAGSKRGDVAVVDRQEMQNVRHSLFGFELPHVRLFGGSGDAKDSIKELHSEVVRASAIEDGKFMVVIKDGDAVWQTTEPSDTVRAPRPGEKVEIKRGSLGSYFIQIGNMRWLRGRRIS